MSTLPEPTPEGSLEYSPVHTHVPGRMRIARACAWVGFAMALLWVAFSLDASAVELVRSSSQGWGRWLAGRVSVWGDWYGVLALGVCVWLAGRLRGDAFLRRMALVMGLSAAVAGLGANGIRAVTGRARPFSEAAPGWYGVTRGGEVWKKGARDYQSFPSAHTSVVAGFFAPVALVAVRQRRRLRRSLGVGVAILGTVLMAWARVWVGAHHLSDVTAASFLGLAVGAWVVHGRWVSRRFTFLGLQR